MEDNVGLSTCIFDPCTVFLSITSGSEEDYGTETGSQLFRNEKISIFHFFMAFMHLYLAIELVKYIVLKRQEVLDASRLAIILQFQLRVVTWEKQRIKKLQKKLQKQLIDIQLSMLFDAMFFLQLDLERVHGSLIAVDTTNNTAALTLPRNQHNNKLLEKQVYNIPLDPTNSVDRFNKMITLYSVIVCCIGASYAHLLVHKTNTFRAASQDPHIKTIEVTFNPANVTFRLNGVPVKEIRENIHPNNIEATLLKYACNQERPTFKVDKDGRLELNIEYGCQMDHSDDHSKTLYIILVVGLLVVLMTAGVFAKRAAVADGEVRWRMWRVPLRRNLNAAVEQSTDEPVVTTAAVKSAYNGISLSDKLRRTMILDNTIVINDEQ